MEAFNHIDLVGLALRVLTYIAVVLLMGSSLLVFSLRPSGVVVNALRSQALAGAVLLTIVSAVTAVKFLLMWEAGPGMLLEISSGRAALLRIALAVSLLALLSRRMIKLAAAVALGLALSFGLEGHSQSLEDPRFPWFAIAPLVVVHVAIVSWWLAVIWPLRQAALAADPNLEQLSEKFGRQASLAVPVLLLAGLGLITMFYLSETGVSMFYQLVMIAKLGCVGGLLWLAAVHKLQTVPALRGGETAAFKRFARSLTIEGLLGVTILFATATLVSVGLD